MQQINFILDRIDAETKDVAIINNATASLGAKRRAYVVIGVAIIAFTVIFLGFGLGFISHVIGCTFPVYASLRAIEASSQEETTQWLMYWVIYAAFGVVETLGDRLLFWFPMYFAAKIAFLIYCQAPFFRGASFLYLQFVGPWFARNRAALEAKAAHIAGAATFFNDAIGALAPKPAAAPAPAPEVNFEEIFATTSSTAARQRAAAAGGASSSS